MAGLTGKYALALHLTDAGLDSTVLSEFRSLLIEGEAGQTLIDGVLALARERSLLLESKRQRAASILDSVMFTGGV